MMKTIVINRISIGLLGPIALALSQEVENWEGSTAAGCSLLQVSLLKFLPIILLEGIF
jgi:hypothetical protein